MARELRLAVAKCGKFGVGESGDTVEVVERPRGGISVIMADGQGSGRPAKRLSKLVAAKAMSLLADGARDGAVARAVHDHLHAVRDGQVSCTLTLLSLDLQSRTLVVCRNAESPVYVLGGGGGLAVCDEPAEPIGMRAFLRPALREFPIEAGMVALTFTDGVLAAGGHGERRFDPADAEAALRLHGAAGVEAMAEAILERARALDDGRPRDDMTVVALGLIAGGTETGDAGIRRLALRFPF